MMFNDNHLGWLSFRQRCFASSILLRFPGKIPGNQDGCARDSQEWKSSPELMVDEKYEVVHCTNLDAE